MLIPTGISRGVKALKIEGIEFVNAQGLATAGSIVALSADINDPTDDAEIESIPSTPVFVSADSLTARITSGGTISIDPGADPAFSAIATREVGEQAALQALLGSVAIATPRGGTIQVAQGAGGGAHSPMSAGDLVSGVTATIEHGVLTDDALSMIKVRSPGIGDAAASDQNVMAADIDGSSLTATAPGMTPSGALSGEVIGTHSVYAVFDGETAISAWNAGSLTVSFNDKDVTSSGSPVAGDTTTVPPGASGALASFTRGGLNTQVNGARNSATEGSTLYRSFLRITNNGSSAGRVEITVHAAEDGLNLGSWTTPMIYPNGMYQISVADLETGIGINPVAPALYVINVSGAINGYVQHVNWNSVEGLFTDLSGFRAGGGLNTQP